MSTLSPTTYHVEYGHGLVLPGSVGHVVIVVVVVGGHGGETEGQQPQY